MTAPPDTAKTTARRIKSARRAHERKRQEAQRTTAALRTFRRSGEVTPALEPVLREASAWSAALVDDRGGPEVVTAAQRGLTTAAGLLYITVLGVGGDYLRTRDPELASRLATVSTSLRSILQALGLDRVAREVRTLDAFLAARQPTHADVAEAAAAAAGEAIDVSPSLPDTPQGDRPVERGAAGGPTPTRQGVGDDDAPAGRAACAPSLDLDEIAEDAP